MEFGSTLKIQQQQQQPSTQERGHSDEGAWRRKSYKNEPYHPEKQTAVGVNVQVWWRLGACWRCYVASVSMEVSFLERR